MKNILITGANSYVGTSFEKWLSQWPDKYHVDTIDMVDGSWRNRSFAGYDAVFHVAGIAHSDINESSDKQKALYYDVNTKLAIQTAAKAKQEKVKQFIFMSSIIIYSGCEEKQIHFNTVPIPMNFYGDSKLKAEQGICRMSTNEFRVVILRPPMIYGKGSKGNYNKLSKLAERLPFFPKISNARSVLYISHLCAFIKLMIDNNETGIFFPQNSEYMNTSETVRTIAAIRKHRIMLIPYTALFIKIMQKVPCKLGRIVEKAFGSFAYDMSMSKYKENYCLYTFDETIRLTEEK